jgi:predicted transcriptional regulator
MSHIVVEKSDLSWRKFKRLERVALSAFQAQGLAACAMLPWSIFHRNARELKI